MKLKGDQKTVTLEKGALADLKASLMKAAMGHLQQPKQGEA